MSKKLTFRRALVSGSWLNNVAISITDHGLISDIGCDSDTSRSETSYLENSCVLPGIANLHSHAHQRAMAGLAERAGSSSDSFWTWRDTMYRFMDTITPEHLHAIASQLYLEMLKNGYTRVAEFQYLHHQQGGKPYDNPAEMSLQLAQAASSVGIGITLLPVLYQQAGFDAAPVGDRQQRFTNSVDLYLEIIGRFKENYKKSTTLQLGIAAHSLRAVPVDSFSQVLLSLKSNGDFPIHIHIAEQVKEVEECQAFYGARPVEYLFDTFSVDHNWCLVHATHITDSETQQFASSGAVAGLCPTTEANLGDGLFNATAFIKEGGKFGIGSDSHISTSPIEELRWLEYGQRLTHLSRNQLAATNTSTGRQLFDRATEGGSQACGLNNGGLKVGNPADFIVIDCDHPLLIEREGDEILDSWIFSGNQNTVRDVYVAGKKVIDQGRHVNEHLINQRFKTTMQALRAN